MSDFGLGPSPTVSHLPSRGLERLDTLEWHSQVGSWQGDSPVYIQLAHKLKM